jgi:cytochrome c peroxidase
MKAISLGWLGRSALAAAGVVALLGLLVIASTAQAAEEFGSVKALEVNAAKAALGKRLFFDKRLSGDVAISCASCHMPEKGFTDGLALSKAYPGSQGFRNTPTLINTAHKAAWFHDGRIGTNLNDVTRESLTETYVMNMDMRLMQERLKQDPVYVEMFKAAGFGEPSNGAVRNAIPEYLKTLTSAGAPFDKGQMSDSAKSGFEIFKGKAGCAACHSGARFTDDKPHNVGAPENPDIWGDPLRHVTFVTFAMFMGIENYMNVRRDPGAHVRSHKSDRSDVGTFMTPTLRELTYTAPYMHNGIFATLADVVAFYNDGGGDDSNKDPLLKPLGLSRLEQADLVAFLEALSGDPRTGPDFVWQDPIPANYQPIENWREARN